MSEEPLAKPKRLWLDPLLVAILSFAVLWPVLSTPFSQLDDFTMLRDNPMLHPPTMQGFWLQWTEPQFNIYSPLVFASWHLVAALTYFDNHLPVMGFKVLSLIAHVGTAVAAWWVLWLVVRHRIGALVGALLVALHPLQIESLAWTTGLKDIYCGLFSFLTLGFYIRYLQTRRARPRYAAIAFAILATLSKPTAMVLPAILLLADVLLIDRPWRKRLAGVAPFIPISLLCVIIIISIQAALTVPYSPPWTRPLIAADALGFYVWKTVLPINLSVDYARLTTTVRESGAMYWTWIFPVVVAAAVLASRSRRLILASVLFVVPLSPILGLKPFDMQQYSTVADHYMYQSLLGVGLAMALLIAAVRPAIWVGAAAVVGCAVLSVNRLLVWQDMKTLYSDALRVSPQSVMAHGCLAAWSFDQNDVAGAERHARAALAIRPTLVGYDNLSTALMLQGRLAESADAAKRALKLDRTTIQIPRLRQMIQVASQIRDQELAKAAALRWLEREPNHPTPHGLLKLIEAQAATQPATRAIKP